ncbi:hypothetical protein Tco_0998774 [Tanacetum coccineum]
MTLLLTFGNSLQDITVGLSLGTTCRLRVIPRTVVLRKVRKIKIRTVPFVELFLRYRCARTELITSDLICPSTYQLLRNSGGDSGPDLSFDKSASPEHYLNDLIIKYKIPHDLYPRLPSEDFVMSELPDDAIGIYHRMFDFFGVRIPFSSFLLALIKHYRVYFSQLGPQSLQIEPTMTLFRHWKNGFFFINQRAIPDAMVWRHPNTSINDLRPAAGSFNMADMRRLSAHVIKLRDMPEVIGIYDFLCLPKWTGAEVQEEPHLDVRPSLQRLPFYCTPPATADAVIPDPAPEDLAVGTPSSKIVAKAEASQKRKASTFGAASSHVAKRDSDDESDGDDDACVEISLVTPLCSAAMIPSLGNQCQSSATPAAEGSNTRDSQGKGIMVDDAAAPSGGASRPRPSSGPAPSYRDISGDAIHMDFFPFFDGPYYATYHEDVDLAICKTIVDQFPTPGELVCVESLSDDQLTAKMGVLHCMMMSHGGEILARYRGLNQSHHEYVLSADSRLEVYEEKAPIIKAKKDEEILRLKTTPPEFSSFFRGQFKDLVRKFLASYEFSRVQGELLSLAASAGFERGLSMHRTKDEFAAMLNKMVNFMSGAQDRLAKASPLPKKLLSANVDLTTFVVASEHNEEMINSDVDGSDPKMTNDTAAIKSGQAFVQGNSVSLNDAIELVAIGSGRISTGPNDVVVALSAHEKGNGLDSSSAAGEEVKGAWLLVFPFSLIVTFSLHDVVVHRSYLPRRRGSLCLLYAKVFVFNLAFPYVFHLYGRGSVPGALLVAFPFLLFVSSTNGLVLIPTDTSWLRNCSFIVANPVNTSAFRELLQLHSSIQLLLLSPSSIWPHVGGVSVPQASG